MAKLKSLFGGSAKVEEQAPPKEMTSRNRTPSVVARLMGLEMLPSVEEKRSPEKQVLGEKRVHSNTLVDITVSGKQLNGVTGRSSRSSQKSTGFDELYGKTKDEQKQAKNEFEARLATQGAECLQSIQLDELNKQLMAKHIQVMDQLNDARQKIAGGEKQIPPSKGLSDSSEFLDAVELLQANRQFFEKYFQTSGALQNIVLKNVVSVSNGPGQKQEKRENKLKVANKIPHFLSGQSSPRPGPQHQFEEEQTRPKNKLSENRRESSILLNRDRKYEGPINRPKDGVRKSGGNKLSEARSGQRAQASILEERAPVKDTKDIAKLIAKKIKESITKEVARTFYSDVDSAVSPQSIPEELETRKNQRSLSIASSPYFDAAAYAGKRTANLHSPELAKRAESLSPRARRHAASSTKQQTTKSNSTSSQAAEEGLKVDCSKSARVIKSQREKKPDESKANSPRTLNKHRSSVSSPDASPRVPSPRLIASLDNGSRPSKQRSSPVSPRSRGLRQDTRDTKTVHTSSKGEAEKKTKVKPQVPKNKTIRAPESDVKPVVHCEERVTTDLDEAPPEFIVCSDLDGCQPPVAEVIPELVEITPTKNEKEEVTTLKEELIVFEDNKSSPISVLELIDEEEDGQDVTIEPTVAISRLEGFGSHSQDDICFDLVPTCGEDPQPVQTVDEVEEEVKHQAEAVICEKRCSQVEEQACPRDIKEEMLYVKRLVSAAGFNDPAIQPTLDPSQFEGLEDDYSREDTSNDPVKFHLGAISRWLVFDFTSELLSQHFCRPPQQQQQQQHLLIRFRSKKQILGLVWSSICEHYYVRKSKADPHVLVNMEIAKDKDKFWESGYVEICQQIEMAIFNSLIEEAITDLIL